MADLSITAANVKKGTTGEIKRATAGATITAGQVLYKDTSDSNKFKLADVTTSSATATVAGVALNNAAASQPVNYVDAGTLDLGATLTVGSTYVLSASGAIAPIGDLASSDYVSYIGYATAADSMTLMVESTGVTVP